MTDALRPPLKKDPQKRTVSPTLPPGLRSRAALGLSAAAAEGRFALQSCADCGALQYPPRDACNRCLSVDLRWRDVDPGGTLLAETTIHTTVDVYFRERMPWRTGTVQLDAGPVVIETIDQDCSETRPLRKRQVQAGLLNFFVGGGRFHGIKVTDRGRFASSF